MAQKNNLQCFIREYTASDRDVVISLFRNGILEHVYPAFFKAMSHPDHIGVTLSICMAGYVLGGSSYFQALLFCGAWAGLVYFCCHEIYNGYLNRRLGTEMADIQASFLDNPDNCFWVAEIEVNGKSKVAGVVAVLGRRGGDGDVAESERGDNWNGGAMRGAQEIGQDLGDRSYGEVPYMVVSFACRRNGLGSELAQKAMDFCKKRNYSRVIMDTSSPQVAAISLYRKLGFIQTASHSNTHANRWFSKLARINVMRMEKFI